MGLQFGALLNLHGRFPVFQVFPVYLLFGLAPNFSILCIDSSFIVCRFFVVISASGLVFFLFLFVASVEFFSSVQRDPFTFFVHLFNFLTEMLTRIFGV